MDIQDSESKGSEKISSSLCHVQKQFCPSALLDNWFKSRDHAIQSRCFVTYLAVEGTTVMFGRAEPMDSAGLHDRQNDNEILTTAGPFIGDAG